MQCKPEQKRLSYCMCDCKLQEPMHSYVTSLPAANSDGSSMLSSSPVEDVSAAASTDDSFDG